MFYRRDTDICVNKKRVGNCWEKCEVGQQLTIVMVPSLRSAKTAMQLGAIFVSATVRVIGITCFFTILCISYARVLARYITQFGFDYQRGRFGTLPL